MTLSVYAASFWWTAGVLHGKNSVIVIALSIVPGHIDFMLVLDPDPIMRAFAKEDAWIGRVDPSPYPGRYAVSRRCYVSCNSIVCAGPLWPIPLAFALPAAFLWWRDAPAFRRRRAMRRNECPACGYSLAGLAPGSDPRITCPECGGKGEGARRGA